MGSSPKDESETLEDLSPMELYPFALEADRGPYAVKFRRYRTLGHARAAAALSRGVGVLYEFNFETSEWVKFE